MGIDMYLFMYPTEGCTPLVLNTLAWSWSCNGPQTTSYGAFCPKKPQFFGIPSYKWSVDQVSQWLEKVGLASIAPELKKGMIDGDILMTLSDQDLKDLGVETIALRRKLQNRISEILESEDPKPGTRDNSRLGELSVTIYMSSVSLKGALLPALATTKLHKCVLVCYTGRNGRGGYRGGDEPQFPAGIATQAFEVFSCTIASFSAGGSGGETRLTANISLGFDRMSYHFLGIHDCGNLELLYQFLNLKGADLELFKMRYGEKPDPLQVAPGVSVSIADGKANLVEWGSSVYWSPSTHKVYPAEFKSLVRVVLLAHRHKDSTLAVLPKPVIMYIISVLSESYHVNPLATWPCPTPANAETADEDY